MARIATLLGHWTFKSYTGLYTTPSLPASLRKKWWLNQWSTTNMKRTLFITTNVQPSSFCCFGPCVWYIRLPGLKVIASLLGHHSSTHCLCPTHGYGGPTHCCWRCCPTHSYWRCCPTNCCWHCCDDGCCWHFWSIPSLPISTPFSLLPAPPPPNCLVVLIVHLGLMMQWGCSRICRHVVHGICNQESLRWHWACHHSCTLVHRIQKSCSIEVNKLI